MGNLRRIRETLTARAWANKDITAERQRQALAETARYVGDNLTTARAFRAGTPLRAKLQLLSWALKQAPKQGLVVEFGVAAGSTLREITKQRHAHGFDSFEGLPEHWYAGYDAGHFAQQVPAIPGTEIHVGWFTDTLPAFLDQHPEPFAFVHMDADLYSSTSTVFDLAADRFVPGTVILFDEFFNYPGWQDHEHRAFEEFRKNYRGGVEYLGYNAMHEQLAVRLTQL